MLPLGGINSSSIRMNYGNEKEAYVTYGKKKLLSRTHTHARNVHSWCEWSASTAKSSRAVPCSRASETAQTDNANEKTAYEWGLANAMTFLRTTAIYWAIRVTAAQFIRFH